MSQPRTYVWARVYGTDEKDSPSDVRSRERKSAAAKLIQFVRGRKLTDTTERDDPNAIEIWRTMPQRCATCLRMKKEPEPPRAYDNNTAHFDRAAGRYDRRSRILRRRATRERASDRAKATRRSNRNLPPCTESWNSANEPLQRQPIVGFRAALSVRKSRIRLRCGLDRRRRPTWKYGYRSWATVLRSSPRPS